MTTTMIDDATISQKRSMSRVEYNVRGSLQAVLQVVESLMCNFDPRGYGTMVEQLYQDPLSDQFIARVSRLASCD